MRQAASVEPFPFMQQAAAPAEPPPLPPAFESLFPKPAPQAPPPPPPSEAVQSVPAPTPKYAPWAAGGGGSGGEGGRSDPGARPEPELPAELWSPGAPAAQPAPQAPAPESPAPFEKVGSRVFSLG